MAVLCLPTLRKQQHIVKAFRIFAEKCKNKSLSVAPGTYIHQAYICAKESQNVTQIERHTSEFKITPDHLNILNKSGERHKYDYGHAIIVSGPQGQCGAARLPPPSGIVVCHCDVLESITQKESIHVRSYHDRHRPCKARFPNSRG
jgi:hypothetical protein